MMIRHEDALGFKDGDDKYFEGRNDDDDDDDIKKLKKSVTFNDSHNTFYDVGEQQQREDDQSDDYDDDVTNYAKDDVTSLANDDDKNYADDEVNNYKKYDAENDDNDDVTKKANFDFNNINYDDVTNNYDDDDVKNNANDDVINYANDDVKNYANDDDNDDDNYVENYVNDAEKDDDDYKDVLIRASFGEQRDRFSDDKHSDESDCSNEIGDVNRSLDKSNNDQKNFRSDHENRKAVLSQSMLGDYGRRSKVGENTKSRRSDSSDATRKKAIKILETRKDLRSNEFDIHYTDNKDILSWVKDKDADMIRLKKEERFKRKLLKEERRERKRRHDKRREEALLEFERWSAIKSRELSERKKKEEKKIESFDEIGFNSSGCERRRCNDESVKRRCYVPNPSGALNKRYSSDPANLHQTANREDDYRKKCDNLRAIYSSDNSRGVLMPNGSTIFIKPNLVKHISFSE